MTRIVTPLPTVILATLVSSLACLWASTDLATEGGLIPTSPPTRVVSTSTAPLVTPPAASPTPTDGDVQLELTIVPYPTPGDSITSWSELIDPARVEAVRWADFAGLIVANTGGQRAPISLSYPHDWIVTQQAAHILSIQNEPPESFPEYQGPFVKFEVLWLRDDPLANAGLGPVRTVQVSGDKGILWENDWFSTRTIGALVREGGTYYGVHGYINRVDDEQYQLYRSVILYMISSLTIGS